MRRIFRAYKELLSIIWSYSPFIVISTFVAAIIAGLLTPLGIYVNTNIFNGGIAIAEGKMLYSDYIPFLVLFAIVAVLPTLVGDLFIYGYVQPRIVLILRSSYKGKMLQKLETLKYEHLESEASMEIIDKAYHRAENSVWLMFPMYINWTLSSMVASIGMLVLIGLIRWWLLLTILIPFAIEVYLQFKRNWNIYEELETYWKKERGYGILGNFLRSRDYIKENKLNQSSDFLINTYKSRLNARNKEYEHYYFKHLKRNLFGYNITKIAAIVNALFLLVIYLNGGVNTGTFISLSYAVFTSLYTSLDGSTILFRASGMHINFFNYYDKYFNLSEQENGDINTLPDNCTIEFKNVYFKYPGTEKEVLKGISFIVGNGEKVSIVGQNGEGKTTIIKLLLGLFIPDKGEILIDGKPLSNYKYETRQRIFGPVMQDFMRYSINVKENIAIGNIDRINDDSTIDSAMQKAKVSEFVDMLKEGADTLLGRDFEGGVDLSGGQWQRIAIARAFMGDKPVLILDEPTSQLDPMAESQLYSEFAEMAKNKTALFITHRLGSTMITDRIIVIADGVVAESGSHKELMELDGIYAEMFETQKQWYVNSDDFTKEKGAVTNA